MACTGTSLSVPSDYPNPPRAPRAPTKRSLRAQRSPLLRTSRVTSPKLSPRSPVSPDSPGLLASKPPLSPAACKPPAVAKPLTRSNVTVHDKIWSDLKEAFVIGEKRSELEKQLSPPCKRIGNKWADNFQRQSSSITEGWSDCDSSASSQDTQVTAEAPGVLKDVKDSGDTKERYRALMRGKKAKGREHDKGKGKRAKEDGINKNNNLDTKHETITTPPAVYPIRKSQTLDRMRTKCKEWDADPSMSRSGSSPSLGAQPCSFTVRDIQGELEAQPSPCLSRQDAKDPGLKVVSSPMCLMDAASPASPRRVRVGQGGASVENVFFGERERANGNITSGGSFKGVLPDDTGKLRKCVSCPEVKKEHDEDEDDGYESPTSHAKYNLADITESNSRADSTQSPVLGTVSAAGLYAKTLSQAPSVVVSQSHSGYAERGNSTSANREKVNQAEIKEVKILSAPLNVSPQRASMPDLKDINDPATKNAEPNKSINSPAHSVSCSGRHGTALECVECGNETRGQLSGRGQTDTIIRGVTLTVDARSPSGQVVHNFKDKQRPVSHLGLVLSGPKPYVPPGKRRSGSMLEKYGTGYRSPAQEKRVVIPLIVDRKSPNRDIRGIERKQANKGYLDAENIMVEKQRCSSVGRNNRVVDNRDSGDADDRKDTTSVAFKDNTGTEVCGQKPTIGSSVVGKDSQVVVAVSSPSVVATHLNMSEDKVGPLPRVSESSAAASRAVSEMPGSDCKQTLLTSNRTQGEKQTTGGTSAHQDYKSVPNEHAKSHTERILAGAPPTRDVTLSAHRNASLEPRPPRINYPVIDVGTVGSIVDEKSPLSGTPVKGSPRQEGDLKGPQEAEPAEGSPGDTQTERVRRVRFRLNSKNEDIVESDTAEKSAYEKLFGQKFKRNKAKSVKPGASILSVRNSTQSGPKEDKNYVVQEPKIQIITDTQESDKAEKDSKSKPDVNYKIQQQQQQQKQQQEEQMQQQKQQQQDNEKQQRLKQEQEQQRKQQLEQQRQAQLQQEEQQKQQQQLQQQLEQQLQQQLKIQYEQQQKKQQQQQQKQQQKQQQQQQQQDRQQKQQQQKQQPQQQPQQQLQQQQPQHQQQRQPPPQQQQQHQQRPTTFPAPTSGVPYDSKTAPFVNKVEEKPKSSWKKIPLDILEGISNYDLEGTVTPNAPSVVVGKPINNEADDEQYTSVNRAKTKDIMARLASLQFNNSLGAKYVASPMLNRHLLDPSPDHSSRSSSPHTSDMSHEPWGGVGQGSSHNTSMDSAALSSTNYPPYAEENPYDHVTLQPVDSGVPGGYATIGHATPAPNASSEYTPQFAGYNNHVTPAAPNSGNTHYVPSHYGTGPRTYSDMNRTEYSTAAELAARPLNLHELPPQSSGHEHEYSGTAQDRTAKPKYASTKDILKMMDMGRRRPNTNPPSDKYTTYPYK